MSFCISPDFNHFDSKNTHSSNNFVVVRIVLKLNFFPSSLGWKSNHLAEGKNCCFFFLWWLFTKEWKTQKKKHFAHAESNRSTEWLWTHWNADGKIARARYSIDHIVVGINMPSWYVRFVVIGAVVYLNQYTGKKCVAIEQQHAKCGWNIRSTQHTHTHTVLSSNNSNSNNKSLIMVCTLSAPHSHYVFSYFAPKLYGR